MQVQSNLYDLLELDLEAGRISKRVAELNSGEASALLRAEVLQLSSQIADALHKVENLELEKSRAEADLKSVEQRIARDNALLNTTSSGKDAQGIQSELASLKARKSDLEDAELAILERLDEANAELAELRRRKQELDAEVAASAQTVDTELVKLQSSLALLSAKRQQLLERIPSDVQDLYSKRAARGVPVGKLIGRECGACRMSLTVGDFNQVHSLPADQLASCPECQAILVRF